MYVIVCCILEVFLWSAGDEEELLIFRRVLEVKFNDLFYDFVDDFITDF